MKKKILGIAMCILGYGILIAAFLVLTLVSTVKGAAILLFFSLIVSIYLITGGVKIGWGIGAYSIPFIYSGYPWPFGGKRKK